VTRLRWSCSRDPKFASKKWSGHDTADFDCENGHRGLEQSCKLGKPLGIVASAPIGIGGYGTKVSPQSIRRRRHEQ
jgi:hypothetical protein